MADEPEKKQSSGAGEGLTVQAVGGAIGVLWVLNEKSKGHYYEAGYELALGTVITAIMYALWKVLGRRIMRWARK